LNNAKSAAPNSSAIAQKQQENQLLLDKAKLLLTPTQVSQYNKAIAMARKIKPNEPLYEQAQDDIQRWSHVILDIAEGRAKQGKFEEAIEAAKLLPQEHQPTYQAAQRSISQWQKERVGSKNNEALLQQAQGLLNPRQASSYNQAIALLSQIAPGQPKYSEAQQLINQWSQNILDLANRRAKRGQINEAIQSASLVPPNTSAYSAAQEAIATWQSQQNRR
jgi:hypothetical protein